MKVLDFSYEVNVLIADSSYLEIFEIIELEEYWKRIFKIAANSIECKHIEILQFHDFAEYQLQNLICCKRKHNKNEFVAILKYQEEALLNGMEMKVLKVTRPLFLGKCSVHSNKAIQKASNQRIP